MLNDYDPSSRYRNRASQRVAKAFSTFLIILISGATGFWFGNQFAAEQQISYREQAKTLEEQNTQLQQTVTELRAEAQTANTRYIQLKKDYDAQIPDGPMQELVTLVRQQLEEGMAPERLSFLIRSARPPTDCTQPETKRFVVTTAAYDGPQSVVSVADGEVKIYGEGDSARNAKGLPEAWFDPAKKVTVHFKSGEKVETKTGVLPLKHSIVSNGREYRFTIEEGSRSFARIVFDSCAYP